MLTSIHILLTYTCTLKCEHCFVFASPQASGKISPAKVSHLLEQTLSFKSIEWIIFEGGEPFLVYPASNKVLNVLDSLVLKSQLLQMDTSDGQKRQPFVT
jgi:MoaA/NifB/PqqE/SkfB family radical SAM enzyme